MTNTLSPACLALYNGVVGRDGAMIRPLVSVKIPPRRRAPTIFRIAGVIDSRLTDGDKLFLIDVIQTYLPREGLQDAGEKIMQALLDELSEQVLTAVTLADVHFPTNP